MDFNIREGKADLAILRDLIFSYSFCCFVLVFACFCYSYLGLALFCVF